MTADEAALVHVDTDAGGNPDDLCALAMLLGWPRTRLVAVTTVTEPASLRAALVRRALALAGRGAIACRPGADRSLGGFLQPPRLYDVERYWGEDPPRASDAVGAVELLEHSIEQGAVLAGIGPLTNLATLARDRPAALERASLVLMGGWFEDLAREGLPARGPETDYNVQQDAVAAREVLSLADPLLVPLPLTLRAGVRRRHVRMLAGGGALARLIARQCVAYDEDVRTLQRRHGLGASDDVLVFHHDPLTAAVAAGWDGVTIDVRRLELELELDSGVLRLEPSPRGKPFRVVTDVDAPRFEEEWLEAVLRASRSATTGDFAPFG